MSTCPVEDCPRGDGIDWGNGPTLCVPHREYWAADHEAELSRAERQHWIDRNTWEDVAPNGEIIGKPWCVWPDNFKTPVRPTPDQLKRLAKGAA